MDVFDFVSVVRNHALANYNTDGWDYVVECWEDGDILDAINDATTAAQAIAIVRAAVAPLAERRDEARAESGEY